MFGGNREPKKPGEDAGVLEIEEYEKQKNRITVNIYDRPAKIGFLFGGLDFLAAVIAMIWNFARPILRQEFMPGFEGWFYGFNVYRVISGYLLIVTILVFGIVAIRLYKQSKKSSPELYKIRKITLAMAITAMAMQPISAVIVTIQAINYFNTF